MFSALRRYYTAVAALSVLSLFGVRPAMANRSVMEGIAASSNTVYVDTSAVRLEVAQSTYTGKVGNTSLAVASNVVVGPDSCVVYSSGSIGCAGNMSAASFGPGDGSKLSGIPSTGAISGTYVPYTGATQDLSIGNHNLTGTSSMTASAFFGDGSHLSGVAPSGNAGGDLTGTYPNPTFDLTKSHTWGGAQNISGGSVIGVQSQTANQAVFGTDGRLWIGNNTDSGGTMKKSSLSVQSNSALNPFDFRDTRQDGITYNFVVTTMGVVGIQTGSPDQTTALDVSGPAVIRSSLTVVGSSVTASAFFGDGSHLTGLSAGGNVSTLGTPSAGRGAMFSGASTISTASFYDNGAGAITVPSGSSFTAVAGSTAAFQGTFLFGSLSISSQTVWKTTPAGTASGVCWVGSTLTVSIPISANLHMSVRGGNIVSANSSGSTLVWVVDGVRMCDGGTAPGSGGWCWSWVNGGTLGAGLTTWVDAWTGVLSSGTHTFCLSGTPATATSNSAVWRVATY